MPSGKAATRADEEKNFRRVPLTLTVKSAAAGNDDGGGALASGIARKE